MRLILAVLAAIVFGAILGVYLIFKNINQTSADLVSDNLETFTEKLWTTCKASASPARRDTLLEQINRISSRHFNSRAERESFALLVCIESRFDPAARSKAGAIGLTQIIPKYASEFYGKEVSEKDLYDAEVNLQVGAKRFKALLQKFEGNVALALSGYNSGADSPTTKKLAKLQEGHPETMAYVAKFYSLKEQMK